MVIYNNLDTDRILRRINEIHYEQTCSSFFRTGLAILALAIAVLALPFASQAPTNYVVVLGGAMLLLMGIYTMGLNRHLACLSLTKRPRQIIGLLSSKYWRLLYVLGFVLLIPAFICINDGKLFDIQVLPLVIAGVPYFPAIYSGYLVMSMILFLSSVVLIVLSQEWDGAENAEPAQVIIDEMTH